MGKREEQGRRGRKREEERGGLRIRVRNGEEYIGERGIKVRTDKN